VAKRIKHELPPARWPSAEEAERAQLFAPISLGPVAADTRTWVPAMVPWRATEDGFVTQNVIDWYSRFADGQPGVLVVEATGIRDVPSGPLLRIGHDRFVAGLRDLTAAVRERSNGKTRVLLQILDFLAIRRRPEKEKFFARFLQITDRHKDAVAERFGEAAATDVASIRTQLEQCDDETLQGILSPREFRDYAWGYREEVNDLHLPHVRDLPEVLPDLFASAAVRARDAGFDGVELHFAHAYTMASFLSRTNMRTDGYGGSPEARLRLPLEVFAEVRKRVGNDWCVGTRYLGDEVIEAGSHLDDAIHYGTAFAKAGLDFLSISKGGKFDDAKQPGVGAAAYPYTGPSGHECMPTVRSDERGPFGRNVELATAIRKAVRAAGHETPIITAGGICHFDQAEAILQNGEADLVAAARQSLADPDWWLKMRTGHGDKVRRCIFTNYCEGLDQKHKEVTCQLWDRDFEAPDADTTPRSIDGKRRLVPPRWQP